MIIASRLAFAIRTSRQAHYIRPTAQRLVAPVTRQLSSISSPVDPLDDEVLQGGRYVLELAKLSKEELLARCSEMGITKCKTKSKAKLVELILNKNIDHNIQRIFSRATSDTDKKSNKKNDNNENDSEGSEPLASSEDKVLPHDKMENEEQLAGKLFDYQRNKVKSCMALIILIYIRIRI